MVWEFKKLRKFFVAATKRAELFKLTLFRPQLGNFATKKGRKKILMDGKVVVGKKSRHSLVSKTFMEAQSYKSKVGEAEKCTSSA